MISADVGGVEYKIKFRHNRHGGWLPGRDTWAQAYTIAKVQAGGEEFIGEAYCSYDDIFCYETGRKIALTRAIKPLPKSVRRGLWEAYFNRG